MKKLGCIALLLLAGLAGCTSEAPKPEEKPQPKPPEYLTGRAGFYKVYVAARAWARDAEGFRVESQPTPDAKGQDGKSAIWHSGFASPAGRGVKSFTYSGIDTTGDGPARGISAS